MKCSKDGCAALASVRPVLNLRQFDKPQDTSVLTVPLPIVVCAAHAIPDVPTFVTPQGYGSLCYELAQRGLALPDYGTATITFTAIGAPPGVRPS